jgi:DNA-directed RNA polymerase II subunit RPB1
MNSFIEGLTPSETFFHAMTGRCGSIDTAIKTADSGYTSKKLIKAVEDLKVNYDFTVRNASNHIIQFAYGEDGINSTKIESQPLNLGAMTDAEIRQQFAVHVPMTTALRRVCLDKILMRHRMSPRRPRDRVRRA